MRKPMLMVMLLLPLGACAGPAEAPPARVAEAAPQRPCLHAGTPYSGSLSERLRVPLTYACDTPDPQAGW